MFIIRDWAGNRMCPYAMCLRYKIGGVKHGNTFDSFDDAEDFLCEVLDELYEEERGEYYIEELN